MIVSLLERIKTELAKYADGGGMLKPTEAYNLLNQIYDIKYRNQANRQAYKGFILSNHANEYSNSTFIKFTNVTGKPLIFIMAGNDDNWCYGSALIVPSDYVEGIDYEVSNGTGGSSYQGRVDFSYKTPKKHDFKVIYGQYTADSANSLGLYWYMSDKTVNVPDNTSSIFVPRGTALVHTRMGIIADYLLFNER